ncbi:unnamed protein product [Chrysodeixis includens]|uniref:U6 small nuclear RNA (adenine-(43)-N(6))-methyltransferase n=1 Tax=Chrysodeixis includens TaxID=689277 RepID=A0A9P0BNJ5_CHRIL|nr:unnamed protein product [Chrysodeixis includens]
MALNKYMHPRNIYKTPPDFEKLASIYPEFSAISNADVTGKVTINFKDPLALRVLTKCLLKSDFNLDVDIPESRLVPTLPLRLNYILWLEDLLNAIQRTNDVKGIDIGTGACAIYPLLAAVRNKWHMLGTESDPESLSKAEENIQKNSLQELIKLRKNDTKSVIAHVFTTEENEVYDFCMCNPPFYSNLQELCESRSPARLPPKNGFTGSPQELITEGGELEFCRKLIQESKQHKDNVLLFTTMIGHKYNLNVLIQDLKCEGMGFTHTEFCQGRVTRWAIAWTYKDYDLYNLVPPRDKPRKKNTSTMFILPEIPSCKYSTEGVLEKIKEILNNLSIIYKVFDKRGNTISLDVIANSNTWSNQRRKRRLMKNETITKKPKINLEADDSGNTDSVSISAINGDHQEKADKTTCLDKSLTPTKEDPKESDQPLVHAFFKLLKKEQEVFLEIEFLDGSAGKEGLHQIVQYIKNNWK